MRGPERELTTETDNIMDIREIIRNRAHELGNAAFVFPDIPKRKLMGAINKIAGGGLPRESVVAVVDTSDTEDLSSGLLFAEDALYFATSWGEPVRVPYGEIDRAEAVGLVFTELRIFRKLAKGARRFRWKFVRRWGTNWFPQGVDTSQLCRIHAKRFSPDVAAGILNTIAAAAKEEDARTAPAHREPAWDEKELLAGYRREWCHLKRVGSICIFLGILLCWTLFWGIPLVYVGIKLLRKCREDADLPSLGLPLSFYKADTRALTGPMWWNILYFLGFGISAMCRKSRKCLEIMAAILQDMGALPLETVMHQYEAAFKTPETPWGLQLSRAVQPYRGALDLSHGRLWTMWFFPLAHLLGKDASSFNFLFQFAWLVRAKEDGAGRAFVRAWLKHLEDKGEIVRADLDGRMAVFKPDCLRSAKARMEAIAASADRIPQSEMAEGLRDALPLDDRNIDAFVRAFGADIHSYAFSDGHCYVKGRNNRRVRICPVCGLATMSGEANGDEGRDESGGFHYCGDYCRETDEMRKDAFPDAKRLLPSVDALAPGRHASRTGDAMPSIRVGFRSGAAGKRIATLGKAAGKFAGGKAGTAVGGAVVATFIPGGCLLGPLGALIGHFLGKEMGKHASSWAIGALTDDGGEDSAISVAELVREEFGILATMFSLNSGEIQQAAAELDKQLDGNGNFVEEVCSKGKWRRQHVARLLLPVFGKVRKGRTLLPREDSAPKAPDGNTDAAETAHGREKEAK